MLKTPDTKVKEQSDNNALEEDLVNTPKTLLFQNNKTDTLLLFQRIQKQKVWQAKKPLFIMLIIDH